MPQQFMLLLCGLVSHAWAASALLGPQEIVKRSDAIRSPSGSFSFQVRVKDYQGKALVRENVYKVLSKDMKYTLIETIFPERLTGRKLLMAGGLWLYLPTIKRPTRVGMQQRLTGEVANGDIARTQFADDYRAALQGIEQVKGKKYYKLLLTAKDNTLPYRTIRLWVGQKDFVPLKAEFFALSGKMLKVGEYSELETVMGKPRLTKLVIKDAIQPSRQSHLKYFNYRQETLHDSMFNKETLTE